VFADLKNVAEHVAAAHGATAIAQVPDTVGNPVTVNDPALTTRAVASLERAVGRDRVLPIDLTMGAEDFAYYAKEVPGFFFFVGATPKGQNPVTAASNHSPEFFLDESALDVGLRSMLQVVLDYQNGVAQ
jgi:amidohydrolase